MTKLKSTDQGMFFEMSQNNLFCRMNVSFPWLKVGGTAENVVTGLLAKITAC